MKSKLKTPVKPGKEQALVIPDIVLSMFEENASLWLEFKDIPFSRSDVVIAKDGEEFVGVAYPLYFKLTRTNLFPLMVQVDGDYTSFQLLYYSMKLNKVYVLSMDIWADDIIGTPTEPVIISKHEMSEYSGV